MLMKTHQNEWMCGVLFGWLLLIELVSDELISSSSDLIAKATSHLFLAIVRFDERSGD